MTNLDITGVNGQAADGGQGGFGGFSDFGDFGDIFSSIFEEFGGGRSRRRTHAQMGNDIEREMRVTFEEAAFGVKKGIRVKRLAECETCHGSGGRLGTSPQTCKQCGGQGAVRRQQGFFTMETTCPVCRGSGEVVVNKCSTCRGEGRVQNDNNLDVKIPPGIDEGQRLKLTGEGDAGIHGGPSGDLYVMIHVEDHALFERDGFNIHCTVPISFSQAALGSEIEVPTVTGKVSFRVPSGVQSGKKMQLKGKGISRLGSHGHGDQILHIHVETPTDLSLEQEELFSRLSQLEHKKCNPMSRGFFDRMRELFQ